MTYSDIYISALALIGEAEDTDATADYRIRSEHLLVHIICKLMPLNIALGGNEQQSFTAFVSLDDEFCLDTRLCTAASLELAALLLLDELPDISELLKKRAEAEESRIAAQAASVTSTRGVYGS